MKKRKRLFLRNVLLLVILLSACSNKMEQSSEDTNKTIESSIISPLVTPVITSAPTTAITLTKAIAAYEIPEVIFTTYEIPTSDSFRFVKDMKIGWNLGNTFDAITEGTQNGDGLNYESMWNGVKTSQAMIDTLQAAGFTSIRIPVSWHNHVSGDDFVINEAWLKRVQEVVDYAYKKGMFVILNTHHDISEAYYYPDSEHRNSSEKYLKAIWTQLATRFADYDEHLIYESMNEPRLVGSNYEWWLDINNDTCKDAVKTINYLNQMFVDTVRNDQGNNNNRYLMVPGYGASAQGALVEGYELPQDIVKDKLIISVHAYTPYNFALQGEAEAASISELSSDNANSVKDINQFMDQLYSKFISKGIPVVIGEFGARDKRGNTQDRIDYATYYIATARAYGISCFWWDNNAFVGNGENFGLLERRTVTWTYPGIIDGLMKYAQ